MDEQNLLAREFETNRTHLRAVAYRMLGSTAEADDAVQEAWLRLSRADSRDVANMGGWLTTVVARICLDMLRSRKARGESAIDPHEMELADARPLPAECDALLESIGVAMLVVLGTLPPAERVAFVLHDMFDLSFDEIAPIVGRSPMAARQLASRGRRRVRGSTEPPEADRARRREIVEAFLAASKGGDLAGLLRVLDPDVVLRADAAAARLGGPSEVRGAAAVAKFFDGRAQGARTALLDGELGLTIDVKGKRLLVLALVMEGERIVEIEAVADRATLEEMTVVPFEA